MRSVSVSSKHLITICSRWTVLKSLSVKSGPFQVSALTWSPASLGFVLGPADARNWWIGV